MDEDQIIWIDCEGSGYPPNVAGYCRTCKMCGRYAYIDMTGNVKAHQREDILTMIDRGAFS